MVVAFIDRSHVETGENLEKLQGYGGLTGGQAPLNRMANLVDGVEIAGPFNPTGVSRTPSRALIFVCDPQKTREQRVLRPADHGKPGETRIPAAGHGGRHEAPDAVL